MWSFYAGIYHAIMGNQPDQLIFPAVQVSYDSYIFYNKKTDERVDIDFNIRFINLRDPKHPVYHLENIVMVESKTTHQKSKAETVLEKM